jgi:predicted GNAT family N-acyltransferase
MYSIRNFRPEDAAALIEIVESQRVATDYPRLSLDIPNLIDWMITPEDSFNLVIVDTDKEDKPLGHVAASNIYKAGSNTERLVKHLSPESQRKEWMEIKRLFVSFNRQGKGLGSELFLNAVAEVYRRGYVPFVVVEAENGLAEWYSKHGGYIRESFESGNDGAKLFFMELRQV